MKSHVVSLHERLCNDGTLAHYWVLESPDASLPRDKRGVVLVGGGCVKCGKQRVYRASGDISAEEFKQLSINGNRGPNRKRRTK